MGKGGGGVVIKPAGKPNTNATRGGRPAAKNGPFVVAPTGPEGATAQIEAVVPAVSAPVSPERTENPKATMQREQVADQARVAKEVDSPDIALRLVSQAGSDAANPTESAADTEKTPVPAAGVPAAEAPTDSPVVVDSSGAGTALEQAVPESEQARAERERQEARAKMSKEDLFIAQQLEELQNMDVTAEINKSRAKVEELKGKVKTEADELELEREKGRLAQLQQFPALQRVLERAQNYNGKWSLPLKLIALQRLAVVRPGEVEGLGGVMSDVGRRLRPMLGEIADYMYTSKHYTKEEIVAVARGDLSAMENLVLSGKAAHDPDLAELMFGNKDIGNNEVMEFLKDAGITPEQISFLKKHKTGILLILALFLKESVETVNKWATEKD